MERAEVGLPLMAGVAQSSRDGAASMSQQRASQQDHQFPPGWSRKQWPKGGQNLYNGIGKGHELSPEQDIAFVSFYLRVCPISITHVCSRLRHLLVSLEIAKSM